MSDARAPRIGILGGTFDPVHVGHLVAAVNVRYELDLDRVLLVVANEPWQKLEARPVTPAVDRLALVEAAVSSCPGVEASAIEIERGGPSYTADTVEELEARHPGADLFLVIGADVAGTLDTWERIDEMRGRLRLVVVNRPGAAVVDRGQLQGWDVSVVEIPDLEISSTDLRDRAATGRPLDFLVPTEAIRLLRERSLYVVEE
ncbi:MAG TPA: nicotinate-nucleotide adenylyltransferase [Acidimicrobiales bacterium]|nr:nicotinate-nucleotide adenylyltransferase [Acidimicrobiales bacterium]